MFLQSFKDVNDIGDYEKCKLNNEYYLTTLNLT